MKECKTPTIMIIDICKTCKRSSSNKEAELFTPRKGFATWLCDHYLKANK